MADLQLTLIIRAGTTDTGSCAHRGVKVRSLWALFSVSSLDEAREALRQPENVPKDNKENHIAVWAGKGDAGPVRKEIARWARSHRLTPMERRRLWRRVGSIRLLGLSI